MKTKNRHPGSFLTGRLSPLLQAWIEWSQLKLLYRQGWLRKEIPAEQCETVAEHTLGVAMLAMWFVDMHCPELDPLKVMRIALIHDLGEVYAGDITPAQGIARAEKVRREREAVTRVLEKLPTGQTYLDLWEDYEQGTSAEARLVRRLDRMEMALQARVYEYTQGIDLEEFYDSAARFLDDPELRPYFDELLADREP